MKKLLAILLSVAMLVSAITLTATAAETNTMTPVAGYSESLIGKLAEREIAAIPDIMQDGAGAYSSNKIWKISTAEGLKKFFSWVSAGQTTVNNKITVYLVNDLDLTNYPNLQVTGGNQFGGIFDGQGHKIENWTLTISNESGNDPCGALFSQLTGTLKNLVIDSTCAVNYNTTSKYTRGTSSLVSRVLSGAVLENCKSSATITNKFNLSNNPANARSSAKVGGLIGYADSVNNETKISNLTFDGKITSDSAAGGILGYATSCNLTIENCVNKGDITSTATYGWGNTEGYWRFGSGGIVGLVDGGSGSLTLDNCMNYGTVTNSRNDNRAHSGAIVGIVCQDNTGVTLNNCNNYGALVSVGGNSGFIGDVYNNVIQAITNCKDYRTLPQIEGYQLEIVDNGAEKQGIRIIGSIDSLNYQDVGFNITIKDANGNPVKDKNGNDVVIENYKCKYVYTSLVGMDGDTTITYSSDELRPGGYLFAVVIPNIPTSLGTVTFEVSTFCVTTDGNTVPGESCTFTHTIGTN